MSHSWTPRLTTSIEDRATDETGQGLVEYALILLFVVLAAFTALPLLGTSVANMFTTVTGAF